VTGFDKQLVGTAGRQPVPSNQQAGGAVQEFAEVNGLVQIPDLSLQRPIYETKCLGVDLLGSLLRNEPKKVVGGIVVAGFSRKSEDTDGIAAKRPIGPNQRFFRCIHGSIPGVELGGILLIFLPDIE